MKDVFIYTNLYTKIFILISLSDKVLNFISNALKSFFTNMKQKLLKI